MYTLTASNRRSKVFVSKFIVISLFAILTAVVVTFFSPAMTILGVKLSGQDMVAQQFHVWPVLWRCVLIGWGYAMYAFILLMLLRNQIGAIVTFLLIPLIGEGILMLLLKENAVYLPFTALQSLANNSAITAAQTSLSSVLATIAAYIGGGLLVSAVLFSRRDAN